MRPDARVPLAILRIVGRLVSREGPTGDRIAAVVAQGQHEKGALGGKNSDNARGGACQTLQQYTL